ncbi:hypothetical protein GWO43_06675, partial [candidate division KSB1 bacterium]|nr:hypothetical protein [candidate division KSB1 bacterium]NIR72587.1 hypothetical protein [candidate division KSB1 bacterium]NIS23647.1 hypothetical protein [candidate division KSB1 bacterium]NIT70571.1 hypothetical protein [candidate division KSB1 bacterium]NIU24289.1 hypothetical protein [candidate division KSB1 bacterium]
EDRIVNIAIEETDLGEENPMVKLVLRLKYIDNKNREQETTHWYTWTLEDVGGQWVIASATER